MTPEPQKCRVLAPTVAELLAPVGPSVCTEPLCGRRFTNSNALYLHVTRHHQKKALQRRVPPEYGRLLYICPAQQCISTKSHFSSFKAVKQHYLKLHAQKTHKCGRCNSAAFATAALLRAHEKMCDVQYGCECGAVYAHKATLARHAKLHQHRLLLTVQRSVCSESTSCPDRLQVLANVALKRPKRASLVVGRASQTSLSVAASGRVAAETQTVGGCRPWAGYRTNDVMLSDREADRSIPGGDRHSGDAAAAGDSVALGDTSPVALGDTSTVALGGTSSVALGATSTVALGATSTVGGDSGMTDVSRPVAPELLSAHTQTMYSFDDIEHLLLPAAGDEPDSGTGDLPLFPELSSIDCYTQTPWRMDDDSLCDVNQ